MSTEDTTSMPPSAWRPLIDEWVEREGQLRPNLPVKGESVRVRDAVEVGDHAYVLLSYDVDSPWPSEEDVTGGTQTAVIQAERVRRPWHERDSTRSGITWRTTGEHAIRVHEHLLGGMRAFSGNLGDAAPGSVRLRFESNESVDATVVDGWFLAVTDATERLKGVELGDGADGTVPVERADVGGLLADPNFARTAGDAMYFSPLDLRTVHSLVRWERLDEVVVVATCLEQYDEGGMLRLRIDGIRADEDTFESWPRVTLTVDGDVLSSAVCGEYSLADTISLDIGFRPWLPADASQLGIRVEGIRGAAGEIRPIELVVPVPGT